jgi:hypothetical protein
MKAKTKSHVLLVMFAVLVASFVELGLPFVRQAEAVVGRPLTPVSYAGVARRTTRRTVAATTAAPSPYW